MRRGSVALYHTKQIHTFCCTLQGLQILDSFTVYGLFTALSFFFSTYILKVDQDSNVDLLDSQGILPPTVTVGCVTGVPTGSSLSSLLSHGIVNGV